jgi:glutaredoxin
LQYANKVREVLDDEGFVTFMYIKHPGEESSLSPQAIGRMMREAGLHFVIDTPIARTKPGVLAEAFAVVNYVPPQPTLTAGPFLLQPQPDLILSTLERDVVEIYGGEFCRRTQYAIKHFTEAGAEVRFFDVEKDRKARRVLNRNRRWLSRRDLLPYIRINGKSIPTQSVEELRIPKEKKVSRVRRTRKEKRSSQVKTVAPSPPGSPCTIK